MKLEQQVVSLDLAKRMKELGAPQESIVGYRLVTITDGNKEKVGEEWHLSTTGHEMSWKRDNEVPAYTVAELGEMLKEYKKDGMYAGLNACTIYGDWFKNGVGTSRRYIYDDIDYKTSEADARAKCWIYLKENSLI